MKLSIITINYNDASGLERTIESIVSKKTDAIELIVIDGDSLDNSLDVILQNKKNIDYWISERDKGIYNAMNKGILQAKGEYLMFVNSGDELIQSVDFKKIVEKTDGEDIIYHNLEIIEEHHRYIKKYPSQLDFKYFAEEAIPHLGTLIKKELFEKYGYYNENFKIVSDWAFFMDCILIHKCSYKYVDDCFASFYLGGISSLPHNFKVLMEERDKHISMKYPLYNSLYLEWKDKKDELYKLKTSISVKYLKKLGFLRWLDI